MVVYIVMRRGNVVNSNKKIIFINSIFVVGSLSTIIIDRIMLEISERKFAFFINFGFLLNLMIFMCLATLSMTYCIMNVKKMKLKAFLPCVIVFFTIAFHLYIPLTNTFLGFNFFINMSSREKIVEMYQNDQMQGYQTGIDKFMIPSKYILASHDGRIHIQKNGATKILFYVNRGINSSAIIYVSNGSGIYNGDFGLNYHNVKFLKKNWYSVVILREDNKRP